MAVVDDRRAVAFAPERAGLTWLATECYALRRKRLYRSNATVAMLATVQYSRRLDAPRFVCCGRKDTL